MYSLERKKKTLLLRLTNNLVTKKFDEIDKIIVYYLSKHQE